MILAGHGANAGVASKLRIIDSFAPARFGLSACPSMSLASPRLHSRARLSLPHYGKRKIVAIAAFVTRPQVIAADCYDRAIGRERGVRLGLP
jgi:hypothetical protein